jgi:hypothetical protein
MLAGTEALGGKRGRRVGLGAASAVLPLNCGPTLGNGPATGPTALRPLTVMPVPRWPPCITGLRCDSQSKQEHRGAEHGAD